MALNIFINTARTLNYDLTVSAVSESVDELGYHHSRILDHSADHDDGNGGLVNKSTWDAVFNNVRYYHVPPSGDEDLESTGARGEVARWGAVNGLVPVIDASSFVAEESYINGDVSRMIAHYFDNPTETLVVPPNGGTRAFDNFANDSSNAYHPDISSTAIFSQLLYASFTGAGAFSDDETERIVEVLGVKGYLDTSKTDLANNTGVLNAGDLRGNYESTNGTGSAVGKHVYVHVTAQINVTTSTVSDDTIALFGIGQKQFNFVNTAAIQNSGSNFPALGQLNYRMAIKATM